MGIVQTTIEVVAEEKIGLPQFSSVTVGTRLSRTFDGQIDEEATRREMADLVESYVANERQQILASIQGK